MLVVKVMIEIVKLGVQLFIVCLGQVVDKIIFNYYCVDVGIVYVQVVNVKVFFFVQLVY